MPGLKGFRGPASAQQFFTWLYVLCGIQHADKRHSLHNSQENRVTYSVRITRVAAMHTLFIANSTNLATLCL